MNLPLNDIPHDAARRFAALVSLAERLELPENAKALDVGGYPGTFARLLRSNFPGWSVHTTDVTEAELEDYTTTSGSELPFEENQFDVVFSSDVLEHVPDPDRSQFISELCRVSRNAVIIGAPFHQTIVAEAERSLNEHHQKKFGKPHPWLVEHVENGLPKLGNILAEFSAGRSQALFQSTPLQDWLLWHWSFLAVSGAESLDSAWKESNSSWNDVLVERLGVDGLELEQLDADKMPSFTPYRYIIVSQPKSIATFASFPAEKNPPEVPGASSALATSEFLTALVSEVGEKQQGGGTEAINDRLKQALELAEGENERIRREADHGKPGLLRRFLKG